MTKIEKRRCEQLAQEAIESLSNASREYGEWKLCEQGNNSTGAHVSLRKADRHQGYAEGIYQALAVIGYSSESMKELSEMI
mgnify:CR=1 FL=1